LKQARWVVDRRQGGLGIVVEDLVEQHPLVPAERKIADQETVENNAKGVDVASAINPMALAPGLLGAHVRGSPEDLSVHRHRDFAGGTLGQSEVQDYGRSVGVRHDVRRLDVTVDDALPMGVIEAIGRSDNQFVCFAKGESASGPSVGQRDPIDEIADQVRHTVLSADFVHRDDRLVSELC
jgi:hypothetical protein